MNLSSDRVLQYLAGNENIEDISIEQLQKLAAENPYFAVAQFLLAKKFKSEKDSSFLPQAQKTALYFSNPFWLHYQLSNESWQHVLSNDLAEEDIENTTSTVVAEASENKGNEPFPASLNKEVEAPGRPASESDVSLAAESAEKTSQLEEEMAALVPEPDTGTVIFLDQLDEVVEEIFNNDNEKILQETYTPEEQETATETSLPETPIPPFTSDVSKENVENTEPDEHERMFQNIKAMLDATSEEADADIENAVIPIDPYYTIDYFASQGIKLDLEQNPKDQLGQHLKKFTHWLKHMKKLGPEDATEVITRTDIEADIQKIAESSNTVREVVTEAMASVLEKQGKNDKAIELYKKLSFLIPDKSAYFAVKIKNLKGI